MGDYMRGTDRSGFVQAKTFRLMLNLNHAGGPAEVKQLLAYLILFWLVLWVLSTFYGQILCIQYILAEQEWPLMLTNSEW